MYDEPGIVQFQHPLTFQVQSNTDPWEWYIVDLSQIGIEPDAPKGQCDCIAGQMATNRIGLGIPFKLCSHLRRVRSLVTHRINRGEYDQWLTTLE